MNSRLPMTVLATGVLLITTALAVAQNATNRQLTVTNIDDTDVSAIEFSGSGWQVFSALGKTHHKGTATSSSTPGAAFIYGNSACTRIRWFATKSMDRGMADVFVDGVRKLTVDMYAAKLQDSDAVFDTGVLPMGTHTLRVVVKAERNAAATGSWVECDKVEVTHDMKKSNAPMDPRVVPADDKKVMYFGSWSDARSASGEPVRQSDRPYSACVLVFKGPTVRWLGGKGPDHGQADIYLDDRLERTVDSYAPTSEVAQVLFDKTNLATQRMHTLRIEVRREKHPNATGHAQRIYGFEVSEALNYPQVIQRSAAAELTAIAAGTKPYLAPETWKPVAYGATAPAKGVTMEPGPLRDCFDRNIAYLNHCFAKPGQSHPIDHS